MQIEDSESLTESIWNDYTIPEVTSLENNLENVISQELMVADIVHEQLLQNATDIDDDKVTILQTVSVDADDTLAVTCRCCDKNFTFHDLKLHIAEKSTEDYFSCDWCTEIFLLKDLNNHVLTHLGADADQSPLPTWYDNTSFKKEEISFAEKKAHANRPTDTSFSCSLVDSPVPKTELRSIKRVKTEYAVDNAELKGNQLQIEPTVNKNEDLDVLGSVGKENEVSN